MRLPESAPNRRGGKRTLSRSVSGLRSICQSAQWRPRQFVHLKARPGRVCQGCAGWHTDVRATIAIFPMFLANGTGFWVRNDSCDDASQQGFTMIESLSLGSSTHRWFCALAAMGAFACSGVSLPTDSDSSGGMSAMGGQSGTTAPVGSGGASATGGAAAAGGTSSVPACVGASYSSDCSKVPSFQCGPSVTCDGTTLSIQWHEHVGCARPDYTVLYDTIFHYTCTYPCNKTACESLGSWPSSGASVALACDAKN
jgi:hypothetical protein